MDIDQDTLLSILDIQSGKAGDHDPYSALCAMFDIANALYWLDPNSVPAQWEFRQSPMGGLDYAECTTDIDAMECDAHPSGECTNALMLLMECGVNLSDPYSTDSGYAAERALIELGNVLNSYANQYSE